MGAWKPKIGNKREKRNKEKSHQDLLRLKKNFFKEISTVVRETKWSVSGSVSPKRLGTAGLSWCFVNSYYLREDSEHQVVLFASRSILCNDSSLAYLLLAILVCN